MSRHGGQVGDQVVEREEMADRIQHRDREVEMARDSEVPHVGLDDFQFDPGRLGAGGRVRAHRRRAVECGRP
jgi:hypothetical protein